MSKAISGAVIRLCGVHQNNLKGFDLDLPVGRLIVVTGLSGSGKSSLAFDTLYAEGQRRYIETFSPYARQFFDRMDKPRVDRIEGIPPAIAIEQRNTVRTTRSTVGTMTELCDYLKLLWPQVAELRCRSCDAVVRPEPPQAVWETLPREVEALVTFDLPRSAKVSLDESLALIRRQGFQRLLVEGQVVRVEELDGRLEPDTPAVLTVVQDRLRLSARHRARFVDACEQAYHFGKGRLSVHWDEGGTRMVRRFSRHLHCACCDLEYRDPTPALFSFNHPVGACPVCRGFGRTITIDYERAVPDWSKTIAQGVVRPWQSGMSAECQQDLLRFCKAVGIPTNVPFERLTSEWQRWVIDGDPDYGKDEEHEWPRAWYGVKGYFRWLESKAYKMHVRVLLSRYRAYTRCGACQGRRFQPESLLYRVTLTGGPDVAPRSLTLADFYQLTIHDALGVVGLLSAGSGARLSAALQLVLAEVRSRLGYLEEVGLGYLTLDRPTRSLSGGETERVNLTTCLGTRLVNTLYVLDEPSVGLHPRDTGRLTRILERLRDLGNTVVVVEHEASVIRAADHVVDLGPGHGEAGGNLVFSGPVSALLQCPRSLTGQYLAGTRRIEVGPRRPVDLMSLPHLSLTGATCHNLRDFAVDIPLGRLVCVTGVSGSGKTTLVREVLYPLLVARLASEPGRDVSSSGVEMTEDGGEEEGGTSASTGRLAGWELLQQVVLVDQSPIGRTPRSNPAVYIGAFDFIRDLFAASEEARRRGLGASAFSFNSAEGQCGRCRGAGFERIEMQFLSDVFIRCPECGGRRYREHVLKVRIAPGEPAARAGTGEAAASGWRRGRKPDRAEGRSIADLLEATVDEVIEWLSRFGVPSAAKASAALRWLQLVGLGYLRLGQPINTLSGGESQRLKLVGCLAEFSQRRDSARGRALFLLDEPTTGLHFDDVQVLLEALGRLIKAGHSVVVVEHNLEVIGAADWIIDLGPEAGDAGGRVVAQGRVEDVLACAESHTGQALGSRQGLR